MKVHLGEPAFWRIFTYTLPFQLFSKYQVIFPVRNAARFFELEGIQLNSFPIIRLASLEDCILAPDKSSLSIKNTIHEGQQTLERELQCDENTEDT